MKRLPRSLAIVLINLVASTAVAADSVVASRTIQANARLTAADLETRTSVETTQDEANKDLASLIGLEARAVIFKGQVVRKSDVAPPALVERNQIVLLVFSRGGLAIETEGRAMDRGRVGEIIQVMNLGSRTMVSGTVDAFGAVQVGER